MDDLYPNSGEQFAYDLPIERKEEESIDATKFLQSLPVLEEVMQWFEEQVILCDSVKNAISLIESHSDLSVKEALAVMNIMRILFEQKKGELSGRIEAYNIKK